VLGLSYGRPVISSNFGCAPSIAGDAGFLYDQNDTDGLKNAINAAMGADPTEYRLRAEARAAQFSWAKTAERTLDAYRAALADSGRHPHDLPVPAASANQFTAGAGRL
jgi:glycosyltransferase involved in cell wall biosynthesis